jgi:hypothetical protein
MAQTAVNWLLAFIEPSLTSEQKHFFSKVIEQAKEMEKEQIDDAYNRGKKEHTVSSEPIGKTWGFLGEEENNNERRNRSW